MVWRDGRQQLQLVLLNGVLHVLGEVTAHTMLTRQQMQTSPLLVVLP